MLVGNVVLLLHPQTQNDQLRPTHDLALDLALARHQPKPPFAPRSAKGCLLTYVPGTGHVLADGNEPKAIGQVTKKRLGRRRKMLCSAWLCNYDHFVTITNSLVLVLSAVLNLRFTFRRCPEPIWRTSRFLPIAQAGKEEV